MFIDRLPSGAITAAYACRQYDGQEEIADDATELLAFLNRSLEPAVYSVSRLRLKLELVERGLLANVETAVQAGGTVPQLYWAEATSFESNHPLVAQIGAAIGLSGDEIKALFKAAAEREA